MNVRSATQDRRLPQGVPLRPEYRLLLACAAEPFRPTARAEIDSLLQHRLDWQLVFAAAQSQRLVALCYPVLQELAGSAVPEETLALFRAETMRVAASNLHLAAKLLEIIGRAEAAGIALVPYKGPVLAEMAYGNLSLRQFIDLDFILPHRELRAAWELIEGLGYRPANPALVAPDAPVPGEYVFLSAKNSVRVELHTECTLRHFPSPPDLNPLLARRQTVRLLGHPVQTFSREDTLPLLAVHGAKDFWLQLLWICDVAYLIETPGFEWAKALEQAGHFGCRRMTNVALLLASETLDAAIPENVLFAAKADAEALAQTRWLSKRLFTSGLIGRREQLLYRMRMVEGFWPGLRYAARLVTKPAADDWDAVQLPTRFGFAYTLLRPLRLFRRDRGDTGSS